MHIYVHVYEFEELPLNLPQYLYSANSRLICIPFCGAKHHCKHIMKINRKWPKYADLIIKLRGQNTLNYTLNHLQVVTWYAYHQHCISQLSSFFSHKNSISFITAGFVKHVESLANSICPIDSICGTNCFKASRTLRTFWAI